MAGRRGWGTLPDFSAGGGGRNFPDCGPGRNPCPNPCANPRAKKSADGPRRKGHPQARGGAAAATLRGLETKPAPRIKSTFLPPRTAEGERHGGNGGRVTDTAAQREGPPQPVLLRSLNPAQAEAVRSDASHLLVLAGAGSGKTRVLTTRIAWVIQQQDLSPASILAVTFTNKAANEMRERLEALLGEDSRSIWTGTFHGLANRILRRHTEAAKLPPNFSILDADDQKRMLRRIIRTLEIDEEVVTPQSAAGWIESQKGKQLRVADLPSPKDPEETARHQIYEVYEETCDREGLVDFSEILLRNVEMLAANAEVRGLYHRRFRHLLVDEFQDTNHLQYLWLRLMAGEGANITVVGDDDQAIYGWRDAKVEHMDSFRKDYPAQVATLEQNYRSTGTILKAANHLIDHNRKRMGKELWTASGEGEAIQIYSAHDEYDEVRHLAREIELWRERGNRLADLAVFYRANAQSRLVEEELTLRGIPYVIYGGLRFFERAEVKDCLAYLQLMYKRDSDISFLRVVNTPPRRIGERSISQLRHQAAEAGSSLWEAAQVFAKGSERGAPAMGKFLQLVEELDKKCSSLQLQDQVSAILERTNLRQHHGKEGGERGAAKLENLDELVRACGAFEENWLHTESEELAEDYAERTLAEAFLAQTSLDAGEGDSRNRPHEDTVHLLTVHAAKGLEFPRVHIIGLEQDLFPHAISMREGGTGLEEERRLFYVGMTRAMRELRLSWAASRRRWRQVEPRQPSQFLAEVPEEYTTDASGGAGRRRGGREAKVVNRKLRAPTPVTMADGELVRHSRFGEGRVLQTKGSGEECMIQVEFVSVGRKWLVQSFAKLEPVKAAEKDGA